MVSSTMSTLDTGESTRWTERRALGLWLLVSVASWALVTGVAYIGLRLL